MVKNLPHYCGILLRFLKLAHQFLVVSVCQPELFFFLSHLHDRHLLKLFPPVVLLPLLKRFFLVLAHQFFVLELLRLECVLILLILVLQIRYLLVFPHIVNLQLKHIKRTAIFTLGIGRCETETLRLDLLSLFDKLVASAGLGGLRSLTGSSIGLEQRWASIR